MKLYKLTDADGYTRRGMKGETLWGEGATHTAAGDGGLCTSGVIHAYTSPLLAILLNPGHANIPSAVLWAAEGEVIAKDWGKVGCRALTTLERINAPVFSTPQIIAFAILCAKEVCSDISWNTWADNWLTGKDRTAAPAWEAARAAARAAAWAAWEAAWAAADTARAAAWAAWEAREAAWEAARAAWAAARAAWEAARAAEAAAASAAAAEKAAATANLDLHVIAEKALEYA